jgi:preprotein translocase subunit SecG
LFGLLLVLLILVGAFMTVVVLLQAGKGGGLASMGGSGAGTDTLIGGRQAATLLTKATWVSGGLFLFLSFVLAVMSSRQTTPQSILRSQFQQAPSAPPPLQLPGAAPAEAPAGATGTTPPAGTTTPATRPPATTTTGN